MDYIPSYKGVLKRKEKTKDGEPNVGKKKALETAATKKKPKQPRVKLSTFGWSAAEWFEPFRSDNIWEPVLPGLNFPLQVIDPTPEEMSRRNIPRPVIPMKTTNPARARGSSDQQQRDKRQKTSSDIPQASGSQPSHPEERRAPTPREDIPEPHVGTNEPPAEKIVQREFSPSYTSPDGRVVLLNDSVKAEPSLVVTLLRGLALPRDVDQVPIDLLAGLGEMCSHLVQVSILT